jgi:hypothetical protein
LTSPSVLGRQVHPHEDSGLEEALADKLPSDGAMIIAIVDEEDRLEQVSDRPVPTGRTTLKMLFESDEPKPGAGGKVTLWAGETKIGSGAMEQTTSLRCPSTMPGRCTNTAITTRSARASPVSRPHRTTRSVELESGVERRHVIRVSRQDEGSELLRNDRQVSIDDIGRSGCGEPPTDTPRLVERVDIETAQRSCQVCLSGWVPPHLSEHGMRRVKVVAALGCPLDQRP